MVTRPGTIGLTTISGATGKLIRVGQWLDGDGFADWQHAFVLGATPEGTIIEAEPSGARFRSVTEYSDIYWCTNIAAKFSVKLNDVVCYGPQYIGVPYSFLDYAALIAHRTHIPSLHLKDYIATSKHMICSQLADQMYADAGCQLFDDGRWPGYVTPLDLYNLDRSLSSTSVLPPSTLRAWNGSPTT